MAELDEDELIQLSFLRDEETDELISAGLLDTDHRLSSPLEDEVIFAHDEAILRVTTGPEYPVRPVLFEIDNISLPREVVDTLRRHLRNIVKLAQETNNLEKWRNRDADNPFGIFEHARVVYQLADETAQHISAYHTQHISAGEPTRDDDDKPDKFLYFLSTDAKKGVKIGPATVESTREVAYRLLRKHPNEIAAMVPSSFRVLHVEQVLRADHARKFELYQGRLRQTLLRQSVDKLLPFVPRELRSRRVADMVDHLVKPRITFHGTQRQYVPSIVRHGFVMPEAVNPETGGKLGIRCGSTYGQGIHCSPSALFSLSYTNNYGTRTSAKEFYGIKLFVCATIMGRSKAVYRQDQWREGKTAIEGADSHVSNNKLEYIVFDSAQIIPVYVIHLDWGEHNAEFFVDLPSTAADWDTEDWELEERGRVVSGRQALRKETMFAGDRQRAKQAAHDRASKYFPYGYGPATGGRFVVEEVAEVSEDEEEYGDYQALLAEGEPQKSFNADFWSWVKVAEAEEEKLKEGMHQADEYTGQRHALRVPEGFGKAAKAWDQLSAAGDNHVEVEDEDEGLGLAMLMVEEEEFRPRSAPN